MNYIQFHAPIIPYSPIDALNRRAAALGSPGYAMATAYADYNGHSISVSFNDYRQYYVAQYYWAGRVVLARGDAKQCISAAMKEYNKKALGTSVYVNIKKDDHEAIDFAKNTDGLFEGPLPEPDFITWKHQVAAESVRDYANPGMLVRVLDWDLIQKSDSLKEYEEKVKEKYGRCWQ